MDKLRAVEEELIERNLVGTPEKPRTYFKGILPMRWGMFEDYGIRPQETPPLVYFGGFDKTVPLTVGLGGSSSHVIGYEGATKTASFSGAPELVNWLIRDLYRDDPSNKDFLSSDDYMLFYGIDTALRNLGPPTQQLEFLAKTLTFRAKFILGTPIYVQQTHPLPEQDINGLDNEWMEYLNKRINQHKWLEQ